MIFRFKDKLTPVLYLASGFTLAVFLSWSLFVLYSAANIADRTDEKNRVVLVQNEIARQVDLMARDQSQISNWDDTLKALNGDLDKSFMRREIAEWLWEDFDIEDSIIVAPSGQPVVTVHRAKLLEPDVGKSLVEQNQKLIDTTTKLYFEGRKRHRNGYSFPEDPVRPGTEIHAHEFRMTSDTVSLFLAQAIVPSEGFLLPDGKPFVLLTQKPLTESVMTEIRDKLGLSSFEIVPSDRVTDREFEVKLSDFADLKAVWNAPKPSTAIWQRSIPWIVLMVALFGALLWVFSRKYGQALIQLKESEINNAFMAFHDPLTRLPNRARLDQTLERIANANGQTPTAILCVDLDKFKPINDTWGHHAGDAVLQTTAERLNDVVEDKGIVARVGGDEFTVVIYDASDAKELKALSNEIVSVVSLAIPIGDMSVRIGASVGVAIWSDYTASVSDIIRQADQALYAAKSKGRGCAEIIDIRSTRNELGTKNRLVA